MELFKRFVSCTTSAMLVFATLGLDPCSASGEEGVVVASSPVETVQAAPAGQGSEQMQLPDVALTADGLDELLAPIALYPDPVLAVMLQAAGDPQEVMDGGNWLALDQNASLKEAALDQASSKAGFTPVMQAMLHYPSVVDMMCTQFDWTKQLGASYKADPKSVLASVQRLRAQAVDNGALKTSSQMKVDVKQDEGQQVVAIAPANPKVVYVPAYDPVVVYAAPAPTTVVVQQQSSGVSTGGAVAIGLLSFGAGIALGMAINNNNYYYPRWGYGGVYYGGRPYYPPPYRPVYGGGWHGGYGYNRPVHYGNNNIYINNSHNYYNRFNGNNNMKPGYKPNAVPYNNRPGSVSAKNMGNRPEAHKGVTANNRAVNTNNRPAAANNSNFRGQSTYQGAKNNTTPNAGNRAGAGQANANRPSTMPAGNASAGNRGGGGGDRGFGQSGSRPSTGNAATTRPAGGGGQAGARPAAQPARQPSEPSGAFGGASNAKGDRQASSRGQQSMGAGRFSGGDQARSQGGGRKK